MRTVTDERATLQIRIAINKILKNKNSINTAIANLISHFSHRTVLRIASKFECPYPSEYYIVSKVHSPFWATTVNMPSRVVFSQSETMRGTNFGSLRFAPDWSRASDFHKKKYSTRTAFRTSKNGSVNSIYRNSLEQTSSHRGVFAFG